MSEKRHPDAQDSPGAPAAHAGAAGARGGYGRHGPSGGHEEPHEGAPEWLISFADNVMLQMGFFVILLALAMKAPSGGGEGKRRGEDTNTGVPAVSAEQLDFAIAVRAAFNNPVQLDSTDARDVLLVQRLLARQRGSSEAEQEGLEGTDHDVQTIREGGLFGAGGVVPFETDSAVLDDVGRKCAVQLGTQFRGCRTMLEVRGHCSAAEAFKHPARGMELSYQRAYAVAEVLVAQGLGWNQLRLTACADNDRVNTRTYADAGHRRNQRAEVIEIDQVAPDAPEPAP